jgi:hypothetical protein
MEPNICYLTEFTGKFVGEKVLERKSIPWVLVIPLFCQNIMIFFIHKCKSTDYLPYTNKADSTLLSNMTLTVIFL